MSRRTVGTQESITLRDIYEIVDRMESKMDERMSKLETRTDVLETYRDRALGVLSVFSIFVGFASTWIWEKITK